MITEAQWNGIIGPKIMALPGMTRAYGSDFIAEPVKEGVNTYIKFMSDGGMTDDHNGEVLGNYLTSNGCIVEQARPRSMIVDDADLIRLFL